MVRSYTRGSEGGVLSEAGFTGWRGFSGWIEAVGLEEVLVGEDFVGGRVGHDDASVHDDGPGEYLLDHVHVVGVRAFSKSARWIPDPYRGTGAALRRNHHGLAKAT